MNRENNRSESPRFAEIVRKLQIHDPSGMDDLQAVFGRGIRFLLARKGMQETEGVIRIILRQVSDSVAGNAPRDPATLPSIVRAVMHEVAPTPSIRQTASSSPNAVLEVWGEIELKKNERAALIRFYCDGVDKARVCDEIGLGVEHFDALKSRVIAAVLQRLPREA